MPWKGHAKIAFIGSHSVRKSNAVHAFASAIGRAGHSVEVGREVVRFNPLGINEGATPEAQLWVLMAQVQQELELRNRGEVLVTDRSVVDNFAYYLRVTDGADPFNVEPLIRRWAQTYDLFVRLLPDVALLAGRRALHERRVPRRDRGDPGPHPAALRRDRSADQRAGLAGDRVIRLDGGRRSPGPTSRRVPADRSSGDGGLSLA